MAQYQSPQKLNAYPCTQYQFYQHEQRTGLTDWKNPPPPHPRKNGNTRGPQNKDGR